MDAGLPMLREKHTRFTHGGHTVRNGSQQAAALVAGTLLLAACGGGSGGAGSTPTIPARSTQSGVMVSIPIHGLTPTAMAFQSGTTGPWTPVAPSGGSVTFTLAAGQTSYSVAAMCPMNRTPIRAGAAEVIIQATTSDAPTVFCNGPVPGTVNATVLVDASAFPNTGYVGVKQYVNSYPSGGLGFSAAAGGDAIGSPLWVAAPSDLVLTVFNGGSLSAARIVRNVTLTPNETLTLPPLSPTNDAVTTASVQAAPGSTLTYLFWATAEGDLVSVGSSFKNSTPAMPVIPTASAQAGDYYELAAVAQVGLQFEAKMVSGATPSSLSFAPLPTTPFTVPAPTPSDLPSANLGYNGFTISGTHYYSLVLSYASTAAPVANGAPLVTIVASQGYLGTSTTVTMPDLSSIPGMLPAPKSQSVNVIGNDYIATGAAPWDNMETGNAYCYAPLPVSTQFQIVQSQGNLNFTAP